MTDADRPDYTVLTVQLLSAYVTNNMVPSADLAGLIQSTRAALVAQTATAQAEPVPEYTPAVTVRKSLASREHLISLIDGRPYKTLKRHLASHGLTPEQYRERYGLASTYPMVAPDYSEQRREVAQRLGLGQRGTAAKAAAASAAHAPPATSEPTIADVPIEQASVSLPEKTRKSKAAKIPATVATSRPRPANKAISAPAVAATDEKASGAKTSEDAVMATPIDISPPKASRKVKAAADQPVAKSARKAPSKAGVSVTSTDTAAPPVETAKASKPAKAKGQSSGTAKKTSAEPAPRTSRPAKAVKSPRKTLGIKTPDAQAAPEMAES
ncbi:MAG: MucR family transcriptional regulator [bacterium]|nr:MucR family transcriptional regulator [bacterium]